MARSRAASAALRYEASIAWLLSGTGRSLRPGSSATDLWGVASNYDIWHYDGTSWTQVPGGLTWVSEGSDGTVQDVSGEGDVWLYTGSGSLPWTQRPGSLSQVSVGAGLTDMWGVDDATDIWTTAQ